MARSVRQKAYEERWWAEVQSMPPVSCECGCGTLIPPFTKKHTPARFVLGHNRPGTETRFVKGQEAWNKGKPAPWAAAALEKARTPEAFDRARATRAATRLTKVCSIEGCERRLYGYGWCHLHWRRWRKSGDPTLVLPRQPQPPRDRSGPKNPFYGKTHSPETLTKIAAKNSGPNNWHWKGGVGTFPYGPEFTKQFKASIRKRDNYTCQKCGLTQPELGYTFHVHHIDHDKSHNDPSNLVTLCSSCHRHIHRQEKRGH